MSSGTENRQRTHQVGVRLNGAERALLDATAERTSLTPAEVLRRCLTYAADAIDGDDDE